MKGLSTALLAALLLGGSISAQEKVTVGPARPDAVRFTTVDVFIDAHERPLAAWQFELSAKSGKIEIVGVEGGEHPAFKEAPYYDPAALMKGRIIIAAFNTGSDLPRSRTRVATVHLQVTGDVRPEYLASLAVAGSPEGNPIPADITIAEGEKR